VYRKKKYCELHFNNSYNGENSPKFLAYEVVVSQYNHLVSLLCLSPPSNKKSYMDLYEMAYETADV